MTKSEYQIENWTFWNGLQPDHATGSKSPRRSVRGVTINVNVKRAERGYSFVADAGGRSGGKRILRLVPMVVQRDEGDVGGEGIKNMRRRETIEETRSHRLTA